MVNNNSCPIPSGSQDRPNEKPAMSDKTVPQVIEETISEAGEALIDPFDFKHSIKSVAVVGAGPSGLVAAKALLEQGFKVQVFERNSKVGGIWVFSESAENELYIPAGTEKQQDWLENDRNKAPPCDHSSGETQMKNTVELEKWLLNHHHPPTACYYDLTNNTSTPCLGSSDFPWPEGTPYFVSHSVVQNYYQNYVTHFGLDEHMHLNTALDALVKRGNKWELTLTRAITSGNEQVSIRQYQAAFDGVVLATGQFQNPVIPIMDGLQEYASLFPGKIIHSKQFKRTQDLENKNVLVVGGRVSAVDIARFASTVAKRVHMAYRGPFKTGVFILDLIRSVLPESVIHKPGIEGFWSRNAETGETVVDGTVTFTDGSTLNDIDTIIFATGYRLKHSYFGTSRTWVIDEDKMNGDRFISKTDLDNPLIIMDDKMVYNTYKDIFLISDPTLAFLGAPRHITTTLFFDYQAQAVARVWSRNALLPSKSKMAEFSLARTEACAAYRMDHESECLRSQTLLPWLNLHASKLAPDLSLPILEGPPDAMEEIWVKSIAIYPEFAKDQKLAIELKYQQQKLERLNI